MRFAFSFVITAILALAGPAFAAGAETAPRIAQDGPTDSATDDSSGPADPADDNSSMIPLDALPSLEPRVPAEPDGVAETPEPDAPPPPIERDLSTLPAIVRAKHAALLEAARAGDIEQLRPLLDGGEEPTLLSFGGLESDPIAFLKQVSGDEEGFEVLGILAEILEAGFVHIGAGTDDEMFVWPYFVAYGLDALTPPQKVELYQLLTAGDVEDSRNFGSYIFWRLGLRPDGRWTFFVAGD